MFTARIPEVQLLRFYEPKPGLFIAESPKVIQRAANAGYQPVSLVQHKDLEKEGKELLQKFPGIPVYTADYEVLVFTGFALTRGMLCAMTRRDLPSVEDICKNARRIAILEKCSEPNQYRSHFFVQLPRFIWMRFFSPQAVVILFTAEPPG